MTACHAATLYFGGSKEAAKKRLQKLKAAELIGERTRKAFEPSVLFLTRKAFKTLHEQGVLVDYPRLQISALDRRASVSELTLRHELEIMDVKAAFHSAITATGRLNLLEFVTWPLLYQFEARRSGDSRADVLVKPDGFIRIHQEENDGGASEHTFFLEVDRSTETQDTLVNRAACYLDYYRSGGFAMKQGATPSAYKDFPFRVLMIFKTAERRNNTAERLLQHNPPIFTQTRLTTMTEVIRNPLGPVWVRPIDYREATKGTQFDTERRRPNFAYRRQSNREVSVESRIRKLGLLLD